MNKMEVVENVVNQLPAPMPISPIQIPKSNQPSAGRTTKRGTAPQTTTPGPPQDFLDNRFVYLTISAHARGLSVGVNMNPDRYCKIDCERCELDGRTPGREQSLDVEVMSAELERTLAIVHSGQICDRPGYSGLPGELLKLRHVALSGDGEPTVSPNFADAVRSVVHVRARGSFPFFKLALLTNAAGLNLPRVAKSLELLTSSDQVWAKLDAGTQTYMDKVSHPRLSLKKVLANILMCGRQHPVVIQSLFSLVNGMEPPAEEIERYVERLKELKVGGAAISLVQVYSATRPMAYSECEHLPLIALSRIAKMIRTTAGLKAEVF
jgi:wyosine [tRNA(Phe)-imidazoG37] synthetase (radical SAM superfamily)